MAKWPLEFAVLMHTFVVTLARPAFPNENASLFLPLLDAFVGIHSLELIWPQAGEMGPVVIIIPLSLPWSCDLSSWPQPLPDVGRGCQVLAEGVGSGPCIHPLKQVLWEHGICGAVITCVVLELTTAFKPKLFACK